MPAALPLYVEPDPVDVAILFWIARGRTAAEVGRKVHLSRTGVESRLRFLVRKWRLTGVKQLLVLSGQLHWCAVPNRSITQQQPRRPVSWRSKPLPAPSRHPWKRER